VANEGIYEGITFDNYWFYLDEITTEKTKVVGPVACTELRVARLELMQAAEKMGWDCSTVDL
jgi:hypothetical protein